MLEAKEDSTRIDLDAMLNASKEETREQYVARQNNVMENIDALAPDKKILNEERYERGLACKSAITSLWCYKFNNDIKNAELDKKVSLYDAGWGKALAAYNRKFLIKDKSVKSLANYLVWRYARKDLDTVKVLKAAIKYGILRKNEQGSFFVVGLIKKVGDNMFSTDRRGRDHRQYVDTIGRQAFRVNNYHKEVFANHKTLIAEIPMLHHLDNETYIGSGKGASREPAVKDIDLFRIMVEINNV